MSGISSCHAAVSAAPIPVEQDVSECLTVVAFCLESCRPGGADVRHFLATVAAAVELLEDVRNVLLCDNEAASVCLIRD